MPENFQDLRNQFQIPTSHKLIQTKYSEKDRSNHSIEIKEIQELDEQENVVATYKELEYIDAYGSKITYSKL